MHITARNVFTGTITALHKGPVSAQLTVGCGTHEVVASLTTAAADRIGAQLGAQAVAIVKASDVVLITDFAGYRLGTGNQLAGTISRVQQGAVSALVALTLGDGTVVSATVTNDAVEALALAPGQAATAVFTATAVMVGVR